MKNKISNPQVFRAVSSLYEIANEIANLEKFKEEQITKRIQIIAETEEKINKIHSARDIILAYLDMSFEERKRNFQNLFETLDKAQTEGNIERMGLILNSILELAKNSPLKVFMDRESFTDFMNDPTREIEL